VRHQAIVQPSEAAGLNILNGRCALINAVPVPGHFSQNLPFARTNFSEFKIFDVFRAHTNHVSA